MDATGCCILAADVPYLLVGVGTSDELGGVDMVDVLSELVALRVPQVEVGPRKRGTSQVPPGKRLNWVDGEFIRGPLPLAWLTRACGLRGPSVLAVALAIWFLAGLRNRKDELKLTSATLGRFGVVDRSTKSRALEALEKAALIRVNRRPGKNPLVTILEYRDGQTAASRADGGLSKK